MKKKVIVAMSGGVDSSVAALLLKEQGYDVVGVSMQLYSCNKISTGSCCSSRDRLDAMEVCRKLGIPFKSVDFRDPFKEFVVEPFVKEYLKGRTPSPCILCNKYLKFGLLYNEMENLGGDFLATGHYSRIAKGKTGGFSLLRGIDKKKDQSYFLFVLSQKDLLRTLFPVGALSKEEVRNIAKSNDLPTGSKEESQEICFVEDDDYVSFIEGYASGKVVGGGDFVDLNGKVLGRHKGIHAYTIGQRRGLGFGVGRRQYVIKIDAKRNQVVLGSRDELLRREIFLSDVSLLSSREELLKRRGLEVQIRSVHKAAEAELKFVGENQIKVTFAVPQVMITPGQAAVIYDGEELLGGGWIE